jgi:RNA polymerase-binding transcription factor DksA
MTELVLDRSADKLDEASAKAEQFVSMAIKSSQAAIETKRREFCIECGDHIPPERISAWCVPCKQEIEKRC